MTLGYAIKYEGWVGALLKDRGRRKFNALVKESLEEAAKHWITEYLPIHFEPRAVQRYGYEARSQKYNRWKRVANYVTRPKGRNRYSRTKGASTSERIPATKPPRPHVYTGDEMKDVLGRPVTGFNIRTTATSNKIKVKVPIRLPHFDKYAYELGLLANEEVRAMHGIAIEFLRKKFLKLNGTATVQRKAA